MSSGHHGVGGDGVPTLRAASVRAVVHSHAHTLLRCVLRKTAV
jgi:hypothetical protein